MKVLFPSAAGARPSESAATTTRALRSALCTTLAWLFFASPTIAAQETDQTQTPNSILAGIAKSLEEEIENGRGDLGIPGSSRFVIARDPFRAIARGRALFQRKFTHAQGLGPRFADGSGDIAGHPALGAGLADSCAACHSRPQGSAGFGGDVFTRPASRDAPHLFGLGLVEMLADEMTAELRTQRKRALEIAAQTGKPCTAPLYGKGVSFGRLVANPDGTIDATGVEGVDPDLRVRPFFAQGGGFSIREFLVGAFKDEMGLQACDSDLASASAGGTATTPSGLVLDGAQDQIGAPPAHGPRDDPDGDGARNEIDVALVDYLEFYLLNYFRPATGRESEATHRGAALFREIGCAACHVPDITIEKDRRVADVETRFDDQRGNPFNSLFAQATPLLTSVDDGSGQPMLKLPSGASFVVHGIFSDLKRHDVGRGFWERNFDDSVTKEFVTEPLWGVASSGPWGHDGRSVTLADVILRHGGEAQLARDRFEKLPEAYREDVLAFLGTLILFPPPATPSNLSPGNPDDPDYPVKAHGKIDLSVLFNDPSDRE